MGAALVGFASLLIILWFLRKFVQASPQGAAKLVQKGGGVAALALAIYLGARGELFVALPLGYFGLGLLGWAPLGSWFPWAQKSPRQISRVRSAFLEMELDHDTGAMRGQIIAGQRAGTALETLDTTAIVGLLTEFDEESRQLLMAYLDRRDARWREHAQGGAHARERGPLSSGKMTEQEAYQILGLEPGASAEEIGRAHRMLMKKLHPDQGGTTYLAARVNEAKEVLLHRHH